MIDLYTWGTTNGRRPIIMLEEAGIPYVLHPINIQAGEQKSGEFAKLNPFRKIPALVDSEPAGGGARVSMFESAAMLVYLARKTGQFEGANAAEQAEVQKWFMFCVATMLPIFTLMRTMDGLEPLVEPQLDLLEKRLGDVEFLAGAYSIADMAPITRLVTYSDHALIAARPNIARWIKSVTARPATNKALTMQIA